MSAESQGTAPKGAGGGVDVLAVMDGAAQAIEREWAMYEGAGRLVEARAAVAELVVEANRLLKGVDTVNGLTVVQPHDLACFRAALSNIEGGKA